MGARIGIVGAGITGLHLALRLQQFGVDATLYAAHTPDEVRAGPPPNLVTRLGSTRDRERVLGLTRWGSPDFDNVWMQMQMQIGGGAEPGPWFRSELPAPASSVDFRLYLSALAEEYLRRGGRTVWEVPHDGPALSELFRHHELLVVSAGRGALTEVFPRDPRRSPYVEPQRWLLGGLFRGVRPTDPPGMAMTMVPGAGEIHAPHYHSFGGPVTMLLIEAVPGGPFEPLVRSDRRADPEALAASVLELITTHVPGMRERIDPDEFALVRPIDVLQGGLTPTVRHAVAEVAPGRCALAVGDAWIVNDPLTAQGANLGSQQAFAVAGALARHPGAYDRDFCETVSAELWEAARPVVEFTNMFLGEPPPQLLTLLTAAAGDQRVADAFVANLDEPAAMWESLRSPESTQRFLRDARETVRSAS